MGIYFIGKALVQLSFVALEKPEALPGCTWPWCPGELWPDEAATRGARQRTGFPAASGAGSAVELPLGFAAGPPAGQTPGPSGAHFCLGM